MDEALKAGLLSVLRAGMVALGVMLAKKGYTDDATWQVVVGAVIALATAALGVWDKYRTQQKVTTAVNAGIALSNADPNPTPAVDAKQAAAIVKAAQSTNP